MGAGSVHPLATVGGAAEAGDLGGVVLLVELVVVRELEGRAECGCGGGLGGEGEGEPPPRRRWGGWR